MKYIPKTKICGVRTVREALAIADLSADFIGLNFVPGSRRKISYEDGAAIVKSLVGKDTVCVGVFRNCKNEEVNAVAGELNLQYVQLHGMETPEYCRKINVKVIKSFPLESDFNVEITYMLLKKYKNVLYILDRKIQGSGENLNIKKVGLLAEKIPFFLAGGLDADNIKDAVTKARPYGVDVASGVETDGNIDLIKVKNFINSVRN